MSSMEDVLSMLRACLISSKGGVSLQNLKRDYSGLTGEIIPYKNFGYHTLENFLETIPDILITRNNQGEWVVQAKFNENTVHLQRMIDKQKTKPKKPAPPSRYHYSSTNLRRVTNSYKYVKPATFTQNVTSVTRKTHPSRVTKVPSQPRSITNGSYQPNSIKGFRKEGLQFYVPPHQRSHKQDELATSLPPLQPAQQQVVPQPPARPQKVTANPQTPLKIEICNTGDGNWARWIKPQYQTVQAASQSPISPPLPPSPSSPLSPQANPLILPSNIDRAVYPPAISRSKILEAQKSSPDLKSCGNQAESKMTSHEPGTFCHKLAEYTLEHALEKPVFKTAQIIDLNKVKYICSVKVGSQQVSNSANREETRKMAEEMAANLMLQKLSSLNLDQDPQCSVPITSDEQLVATRILKLMQEHPHGLWASEVGTEYSKLHSERLPGNWLSLVEDNDQYEVIRLNESKVLVQLAEEVKFTPLITPTEKFWDVQITHVVSATEVWLRILGNEYSDCLCVLSEEIMRAQEKLKFGLKQVHAGRYVLALQDMDVHRAQVLQWSKGSPTAECRLLDAGVTEHIALTNMACLPQKFAKLPAQAIQCHLQSLTTFCDNSSVSELLAQELYDKMRIASVNSIEAGGCPVVTIFDTSTDNDINTNLVLLNLILSELYDPKLPQGMDVIEVVVSHIVDACEVFVQPHLSVLHWMEEKINAERAQIENQGSLAYLNTTEMYLTVWPDIGYKKTRSNAAEIRENEADEETTNLARVVIKNKNKIARLVCVRPFTEVIYVDYGWTTSVATSLLKKFPQAIKELTNVPHQAVLCKLRGVPPKPSLLPRPSAMQRLCELLPLGMPTALRTSEPATNTAPPVVEIFTRSKPSNLVYSISDTIAMDLTLFQQVENCIEDSS